MDPIHEIAKQANPMRHAHLWEGHMLLIDVVLDIQHDAQLRLDMVQRMEAKRSERRAMYAAMRAQS